ncbi:MAG: RepB family plasmid replication initiator protein [Pseudohongiella sp.]|nr:RepB family plasmid replication initiator protein [Pseudohongiella sp.]
MSVAEQLTEVEVIKNRNIIQSCYQLTLGEHRLITSCIQVINDRTSENKPITLHVEQFAKAWGISRSTAHGQLQEASNKMWDRVIHINLAGSKKGVESIRWLQRKVDFESGEIELHFTDKIYREMYKIADDARVPILLSTMAQFNCQHSHRIYDMMCSKQPSESDTWRWEVSLDNLRAFLDIKDRYPVWADLRKWVIVVVTDEISTHTEFVLAWNVTEKIGRAISKIEFVAKLKKDRDIPSQQNIQKMKTQISLDFYPQEITFNILREQGMPDEFILGQVQSFILFFHERGDVTNTWQSKFVEHCKMWWRSTGGAGQGDLFPRQTVMPGKKGPQSRAVSSEQKPAKDSRSLEAMVERFTDRTWAD